jgi:hypothetical protein
MENVKMTTGEFINFCKIAKLHYQSFTYKIIKSIVIVTANNTFLKQIGF